MKNPVLMIFGALVVVGGLFWFGANFQNKKEEIKSAKTISKNEDILVRPHSITLGPEDARVTIIEFLDPECEACGAMHPIVKKLMDEYSGKVRLVVRYLPFHKNSVYAATALEIARKDGKFWQALDILFSKQNEWASHNAPRPELIKGYMDQLGVDISYIDTMVNDKARQQIYQDKRDAKALGIRSTPTFFVNGKQLLQIGYEPLKKEINLALSKL